MKKLSILACVFLAILSAVVAIVYLSKTAGALPHFFLGYAQGSSHKHVKHGIAFAGLAVVFLMGAWMLSGQSTDTGSEKHVDEQNKKPLE